MFVKNNLYDLYIERQLNHEFSSALPDVTKLTTLRNINHAINLCKKWERSLDVGCGKGHYTAALSAKFKHSVGIEIDSSLEQALLMEKYPNIEIWNGVMSDYRSDKKFDFILLTDIIEHIPDVTAFVRQLAENQEKDGIVYILTPNPIICGPAPESGMFHTTASYHGHIDHYTHNEIVSLMDDGGYSLEYAKCEETPKRQVFKRIAYGFSRRDKRWSAHALYAIVRPFYFLLMKPLFYVIQKISVHIESKNEQNPFNTMAQILVFKKRPAIITQ